MDIVKKCCLLTIGKWPVLSYRTAT